MKKLLLVIAFLSLAGYSLHAQQDTVYRFFQKKIDFSFLKGIEARISRAKENRDAQALCIYASALFYAEHISKLVHPQVDGLTTLREATLIAWQDKNTRVLFVAKAIWASELFGPENSSAAEAIDRFIEKLAKKAQKPERESVLPDPQAFLMAEEEAKLDALRQVAEKIFGVMVESVSNVEDFSTQRDVVLTRLKNGLLLGAQFGNTEIHDDELYIPVTVTKRSVIASIKQALLSQGSHMSDVQRRQLEETLDAEYRAVGMGVVSDR